MKTKTEEIKKKDETMLALPALQKVQRKPKVSPRKNNGEPVPAGIIVGPVALVEARIDVGMGNSLFIRGQGQGLSWDKGERLTCLEADKWVWQTQTPKTRTVFKLLLNDQVWAQGEDVILEPGQTLQVVPRF